MTKNEAAIVTTFTGKMLGDFSDFHKYVEKILGRQVFTHELGSESVSNEIMEASKADFIALEVTEWKKIIFF